MGYQREVLLVLCRYTCCPLLLGCAGILGLLGLPGSYHCCSAGCVSVYALEECWSLIWQLSHSLGGRITLHGPLFPVARVGT